MPFTAPPVLRHRLEPWRARFDRLPPLGRAALLCGSAALVVGAASADWTVERGDTLYHVSRETGVSVQALVDANDIADRDLILVGQKLTIPKGSSRASTRRSTTSDDSAPRSTSTTSSTSTASSGSGSRASTVVRAGDSVASLSRRLDVSQSQFMAANGFTSSGQVLVGARVRASAGATPGARTEPVTHTVRTGDTLQEIADDYGQSYRSLARANGIDDPNLIRLGQRLTIPGSGGTFRCPVKGSPHFINDFGVSKGDGRYHEGIDIFADRGTKVVAPVSGRVEHVNGTRGGKQVHLFGDDGYRYWGTHLDTLGPTGRVEAGQVLGTVGTTGNAVGTPPHLHFEAYLGGRSVNTYPALRAAC